MWAAAWLHVVQHLCPVCLVCLDPHHQPPTPQCTAQHQPPTVRDRLYRYSGSKLPAHRSHILWEREGSVGGVLETPRGAEGLQDRVEVRRAAGGQVTRCSPCSVASSQPLAPLGLWHSSSSTPPAAQPLARSHPPGAVAVVLQLLVALAAAVHLVGAGGVAQVLAAQVGHRGGHLGGGVGGGSVGRGSFRGQEEGAIEQAAARLVDASARRGTDGLPAPPHPQPNLHQLFTAQAPPTST